MQDPLGDIYKIPSEHRGTPRGEGTGILTKGFAGGIDFWYGIT